MSNGKKGNAVIGQSGGPTSVINQSLVGAIQEIQASGLVDQILGARHGVRGIVDDQFITLNDVPEELLERIAQTPAAALGSTRDKPDKAYCEKIFQSFARHDVRYFFYIGGNDSADTARIVSELAASSGHQLKTYHIPKTIDNDLRVHDHTPGFGSAARFVACAMMGDNCDNRSLPGIKVDVIMGRNAGFLTAAATLARQHPEDGPHLIYLPEAPMSEDKFLGDIDRVYKKHGRCLVAVSEGVARPDGKIWAEAIVSEALDRDTHGNVQLSGSGALGDYFATLIKEKLGKKLRVRADTFGYLQRSFAGCVSEVDAREARLVGKTAAQYAAQGKDNGSIAMRRIAGDRYGVETFLTPLNTVAKETKHLDAAWILDGNNVSDAFKQYASPLIGTLPVVGSFEEMKR